MKCFFKFIFLLFNILMDVNSFYCVDIFYIKFAFLVMIFRQILLKNSNLLKTF